jgi:hypothetical protein
MAGITFGLHLIDGNPNLTFIVFIGMVLLFIISLRFGFYAYRNMRATDIDGQGILWEYLVYVGVMATLYAFAGILEIVTSLRATFKGGFMLALVLLVALSVREIYFNSALSTSGEETPSEFQGREALELVFVAAVGVVVFGLGAFGEHTVLFAIQGVAALAFAGYGFWFGRRQTTESMVQGTMIDSLLRHLLPVMAFATLVPAVDLATAAGLPRIVVRHVQVVFVIMTATALMTATIKLRQNFASL